MSATSNSGGSLRARHLAAELQIRRLTRSGALSASVADPAEVHDVQVVGLASGRWPTRTFRRSCVRLP